LLAGGYFAVFIAAVVWNLALSLIHAVHVRRRSVQGADVPSFTDPDVVITLVHGTWARHAGWVAVDSPLRRALSRTTPPLVSFQQFDWSGGNSLSARRRGVQGLIAQLRTSIARWPRAKHYVIGHSHGGNIAFQALADPLVKERVAGVVCLSTPFLNAAPRELGPVGTTALRWLPSVIIFWTSVGILQLVLPTYAEGAAAVILVGSLATGFVAPRWISHVSASALESLAYPTIDSSRVLIVRTAGDEASAALGATHFLSWSAGRLWLTTSRLLGRTVETVERWRQSLMRYWMVTVPIILCAIVVSVATFLLWETPDDAPRWLRISLGASFLVLLFGVGILARGGLVAALAGPWFFAAAAAPLLFLGAFVSMAVGPELIVAGLVLQVTAETTPPGQWQVCQINDPGRDDTLRGGLMHSSSYQHPRALEMIARWIFNL